MGFRRDDSRGVGKVATKVGDYVVPKDKTATIIGLTVANVINEPIAADVFVSINSGGTKTYLVKGAPISPGGTLIAVGGNQKLVLMAYESVFVVLSAASAADVLMSSLEDVA